MAGKIQAECGKGLRKREVRVQPYHVQIKALLSQLKEKKISLYEYAMTKQRIIQRWREERFRVCLLCQKEKKRAEYKGESKYCNACKETVKKQRKKERKQYVKDYAQTGKGLEIRGAKQIVYWAKRIGLLSPALLCEDCGKEVVVEAHHKDYNKPLDVEWLCKGCHSAWHKKNVVTYVKK